MRRREKVDTDDKILNPLFPRMHVKDRDKEVGPKPPPRNKMALYEQPPASPHKYSAKANPATKNYIGGSGMQINSPAATERLPNFYAHNAAAVVTAPMPLLPFPAIFDGEVTSSPSGCKISLGKRPRRASSSGYVEEKRQDEKPHSELNIFQQTHLRNETNNGNKGVGAYAQRYAPNALPTISTMSSTEWKMKQSNRCSRLTQGVKSQSEIFFSGSSTKPVNSGEQVGASELIRSEACPKAPPVDYIRGPDGLGRAHKPHKNCEYRIQQKKDDCRWEIPTTETTSSVHMRPEEAIAIIGHEAFLKLRNDMIKHQKEFVEQVFELHRLIAVQRLMARSRRTSLEDRHKVAKPSSSRTSNPKELRKGLNLERQDDSTKPNSWSHLCAKEMLYLPPQRKDPFSVPSSVTPRKNQENSARNPKPINAGGIGTPWIYPPPGSANHWLVPVLSPSEGLIYKPYPIPSAPGPAGFMPPLMYASCQPIHVNPLKAAQTHPASHQSGIRPFADIPPHSPPFVTPGSSNSLTTSTPAFGLARKAGSLHHHPNIALADCSFKSSWNFSSLVRATFSCDIDAMRQAKDGGAYQDSTARSSPPGRPPVNTLPLFPVEPTAIAMQNKLQHHYQAECQSSEQQTKVIKVVPRHPESDARSIEPKHEERE